MTKKKYKLTEEHEKILKPWADKWIENALSTRRIGKDWNEVVDCIQGLYKSAKLTTPPSHRIIRVDGPVTGAFVATWASMIWWLRSNPEKHTVLCGRSLTENDYIRAICLASAIVSGDKKMSLSDILFQDSTTDEATSAATDAATEEATRDATRDATEEATRDATSAATYEATDAATYEATRAATYEATSAATSVATRAATRAATDAATRAATEEATSAATSVATYEATRDATEEATSAATSVATYEATRDATRDATYEAIQDTTTKILKTFNDNTAIALTNLLLKTSLRWSRLYNGGASWSGWSAYISFFRHVAKLNIDYTAWADYERLSELTWYRYMHKEFCIVTERPIVIKKDEQNRPHCENGPSIAWADGTAAYYWRGVKVPREWIMNKESLDPRIALTEDNVERRRAAAEIIGWDRILEYLNPEIIDVDWNPEVGTLLRVDLPDAPKSHFLRARCGTGRQFCLPVPAECKTAIAAQAWMWRLTEAEYRLLQVRT